MLHKNLEIKKTVLEIIDKLYEYEEFQNFWNNLSDEDEKITEDSINEIIERRLINKNMKNNLLDISKKYQQLKSFQMHGGIKYEDLESFILEDTIDELLSDIGEIEKKDEIKNALANMFYLGKLSK